MSKQPDPIPSLRAMLDDLRRQLRRMQSASPFFGTGMRPNGAGGIDSTNYVPGASGYSFKSTGNAEFNDVTLRGVLVGLDTPVRQQTARAATSGFALTTTFVELAAVTVTVPDGCTRLSAVAFARIYKLNANTTGGSNGAGGDALYVQAGVAGTYSSATPTGVSGSGGFATTTGFDSFDLSGLSAGGTVRINVRGGSGYTTIPADAGDYASVVASLTWLR